MSLSQDLNANIFDQLFGSLSYARGVPRPPPKEAHRYYQCFLKEGNTYECERIRGRGEKAEAICVYSPVFLDPAILSHRLKMPVVVLNNK